MNAAEKAGVVPTHKFFQFCVISADNSTLRFLANIMPASQKNMSK
jgi:hypothetical protein